MGWTRDPLRDPCGGQDAVLAGQLVGEPPGALVIKDGKQAGKE